MHTQKDKNNNTLKNKGLSVYGKDTLSNYYNVLDHHIYKELAERSQKIVTACYMITDFLDTGDALRALIRNQVTEVMHDLFTLTHSGKNDRVEALSKIHNVLFSIMSYLEIVYQNGFISEMNYKVVTMQIRKLREDIDIQIKKSLPYDKKNNRNRAIKDFSFSDSFFESSKTSKAIEQSSIEDTATSALIKDKYNKQGLIKKTKTVGISNQTIPVVKNPHGKEIPFINNKKVIKTNHAKDMRKENILKILKQKRDASINDICALFKDCSSKTIQRDLTDLINEGMVIKEGSRRWSKYNLSY